MDTAGGGPSVLDRGLFELEFSDDFRGPLLDRSRWVDHYLPHWTTPARSAARYEFDDQGLRLRIDADQPNWRDEDGSMRVSNIQTGTFAGPLGSTRGTHRHGPGLTVRTPVATNALWTPSGGLVEATMRASPDPTCMLAIWLVGFEQSSPEDSGEICIAELFGSGITSHTSCVRLGVKAHNDRRLRTEVIGIDLPIDAADAHSYGADWGAEGVRFYVDDRLVHTATQEIGYPLQLMIDLFEFRGQVEETPGTYPKTAAVQSVRGYRRRSPA